MLKSARVKYKILVWYRLSCGCVTYDLFRARGCTTECIKEHAGNGQRYFILSTYYEKPEGDE